MKDSGDLYYLADHLSRIFELRYAEFRTSHNISGADLDRIPTILEKQLLTHKMFVNASKIFKLPFLFVCL